MRWNHAPRYRDDLAADQLLMNSSRSLQAASVDLELRDINACSSARKGIGNRGIHPPTLQRETPCQPLRVLSGRGGKAPSNRPCSQYRTSHVGKSLRPPGTHLPLAFCCASAPASFTASLILATM